MKGQYNSATDYLSEAIKHDENIKIKGANEKMQANGLAGANKKHEQDKKVIENAKQYYLANKRNYTLNKSAAHDLANKFPPLKLGTYLNKVKIWKKI